MIRSLWIYQIAKSAQDVDTVVRLLEQLGIRGFQSRGSDEGRFAAFFPPVARYHLVAQTSTSSFCPPDLYIDVPDPFFALEIAKKMGFKVVSDASNERVVKDGFRVALPDGTEVIIGGPIPEPSLDAATEGIAGDLKAEGKEFAAVVSRFNSFITERLLQGCLDGLLRAGARREDVQIVRVPGAFEIPLAARKLAETKKYDAIICIGCLLRGDTAHYDVIVNEVTRGIGQSAQETGIPHAFGVLTCETLAQAIDRAGLKMGNKGFEAALAAVEMASLKKAIGLRVSGSGKKRISPSGRDDKPKKKAQATKTKRK
jgi:6,7-dimethyl-8-ribityllumazine synthase